MSAPDRFEARVRDLFWAYDRYEATWRRAHGLSANECQVVTLLSAEGALSPTDLSELVGLTTGGVSTLLDRLEELGFVRRERSSDDRRRVLVLLSKRGLQAQIRLEAVHAELAEVVEVFSTDERSAIERYLLECERIVSRRAAEPGA